MSNCGTCRWWQRDKWMDPDAYEVRHDLRSSGLLADMADRVEAVAAAQQGRWGHCLRVTHGWGGSALAYTLDASNYESSLQTRDDFGCVEWAAQENDR